MEGWQTDRKSDRHTDTQTVALVHVPFLFLCCRMANNNKKQRASMHIECTQRTHVPSVKIKKSRCEVDSCLYTYNCRGTFPLSLLTVRRPSRERFDNGCTFDPLVCYSFVPSTLVFPCISLSTLPSLVLSISP